MSTVVKLKPRAETVAAIETAAQRRVRLGSRALAWLFTGLLTLSAAILVAALATMLFYKGELVRIGPDNCYIGDGPPNSVAFGSLPLPHRLIYCLVGIVRDLGGGRPRARADDYPQSLARLDGAALRALGERYVAQTRIYRKSSAPFFIDKLPNNFAHTGLIHLILPHAKIIDARRHPLGCCFSAYKQHFARGQHFTYSLDEIGRYYRDYVELMAHYDAVLPGRVHRVFYERMIEDTEGEVRRLLDYCGLPFDERCLRFYENDRAVRTASSEQVRRPIYREGVDHWLNYEPWLGPLRSALGPVLERYPNVPEF